MKLLKLVLICSVAGLMMGSNCSPKVDPPTETPELESSYPTIPFPDNAIVLRSDYILEEGQEPDSSVEKPQISRKILVGLQVWIAEGGITLIRDVDGSHSYLGPGGSLNTITRQYYFQRTAEDGDYGKIMSYDGRIAMVRVFREGPDRVFPFGAEAGESEDDDEGLAMIFNPDDLDSISFEGVKYSIAENDKPKLYFVHNQIFIPIINTKAADGLPVYTTSPYLPHLDSTRYIPPFRDDQEFIFPDEMIVSATPKTVSNKTQSVQQAKSSTVSSKPSQGVQPRLLPNGKVDPLSKKPKQ